MIGESHSLPLEAIFIFNEPLSTQSNVEKLDVRRWNPRSRMIRLEYVTVKRLENEIVPLDWIQDDFIIKGILFLHMLYKIYHWLVQEAILEIGLMGIKA